MVQEVKPKQPTNDKPEISKPMGFKVWEPGCAADGRVMLRMWNVAGREVYVAAVDENGDQLHYGVLCDFREVDGENGLRKWPNISPETAVTTDACGRIAEV